MTSFLQATNVHWQKINLFCDSTLSWVTKMSLSNLFAKRKGKEYTHIYFYTHLPLQLGQTCLKQTIPLK